MKMYLLNFRNGIAAKLNEKMQFGNFRFSPFYHPSQQSLICLIIYQVFFINVLCDLGGMKNNGSVLWQEADDDDDDDDDSVQTEESCYTEE